MIAVQISLYPVRQQNIDEALDAFWASLGRQMVKYKINPLSTVAWSQDEDQLYQSIFKAYQAARKHGNAVMVTTLTTGTEKEASELLKFLS